MNTLKLFTAFCLGALLLVGQPGSAHATTVSQAGYVCFAQYDTAYSGSTYGTYGDVQISFYSAPSCTGTFQGYHFACTSGAPNSGNCTNGHFYSEATITGMLHALQQAAINNEKVTLFYDNGYGAVQSAFYWAK